MASPTWWNLPATSAPRHRGGDAGVRPRAGFSAGSLNVIASEAGIAKGSLFQYFDDKLDLFITVCEHVSAEIADAVLVGVDPGAPLFDTLRGIVRRWVAYFRQHPLERLALLRRRARDRPGIRATRTAVPNARYEAALRPLIRSARRRGELRADADDRMVLSLLTVVLRHLNSAPFDPAGDVAIPFHDLSDRTVDRWAVGCIDVLEAAFGS